MPILRAAVGSVLIAAVAACSSGGSTTPTPIPPTPGVLQVAGQYQINQQAVTDTCGQTGAPVSVTATVTHTAGANTFRMADTGGTTFNGTVQNTGEFTAEAVFGPDGGGQTYAQLLQGRFTANGFTASLSVHVTPRNCDFTRSWTANKQGGTNTFP